MIKKTNKVTPEMEYQLNHTKFGQYNAPSPFNSFPSANGLIPNTVSKPVSPGSSIDGESTNEQVVQSGNIRSGNFKTGISGWKIDSQGNAEFNNGTFRGTFNIGGTQVTINNTQDIQTSLDAVFASGGGIVYLQPGTYTLSDDLIIPSGCVLSGTNKDTCIIDCATYSIKVIGTDAYGTGTVSINDASTTVTGTGTTFVSSMVGQTIFLGNYYYTIDSVTDTTHLELVDAYSGDNLTTAYYKIATPISNSIVKELTIQSATNEGLYIQYVINCGVDNLTITDCGTGIGCYDSYSFWIGSLGISAYNNGRNIDYRHSWSWTIDASVFELATVDYDIYMLNSGDATIFNSSMYTSTSSNIYFDGCSDITIVSFTCSDAGGNGIEFNSNCNYIQIMGGTIGLNTGDGIKLTATSDRNIFTSMTIYDNGGYGINIAASTCDKNVLNGVICDNNTSGSILDSGTGTLKSTVVNILP